ncbi:hypothetical protein [Enterococcus hirae]|uniref:hypothetical protein n=1 Tax=Enterococcus hirae TaxID=1354 RepID=UPI001F4022F4|nr:hypothetical protein [Enterococcus hirae]
MDNEPTNEKEVCSEPRATAPPAKYLFCSIFLYKKNSKDFSLEVILLCYNFLKTVKFNDGGYPIESEVVRMCVLPKSYRKETPFASCGNHCFDFSSRALWQSSI